MNSEVNDSHRPVAKRHMQALINQKQYLHQTVGLRLQKTQVLDPAELPDVTMVSVSNATLAVTSILEFNVYVDTRFVSSVSASWLAWELLQLLQTRKS
jgi:hypothetical protein